MLIEKGNTEVEEVVGFEPTDRFRPTAFETVVLSHSTKLPLI